MTTTPLLFLLLALAIPSPAWSQDVPESTSAKPLDEAYETARRTYLLLGDRAAAQRQFEAMWAGATESQRRTSKALADAMTYLGEIQLLEGDPSSARATFRLLLEQQPETEVSPIEHPVEVIGLFELVRRSVLPKPAPAVTEVPFKPAPMPWWGYAPLGIPQFLQDRPVRGAMYLGLQLGSLGASIGLWVKLDSYQNISGQVDDDTAALFVRQQQQLRTIQWSTAGLGWLAWGTSIGDSALSWRRDRRLELKMGAAPRPGGAGLQIYGRW